MKQRAFASGVTLSANAGKRERRSRLRTMRFPESLVRSLQKEAADEGSNANSLANSIISRYFDWDKRAREFGFITVHKPTLMRLIEMADDEGMAQMGREVILATWKEIAEFWVQGSTPEKILEALTMRSKFDPNTRARVTREEGEYWVVLRHDFGPKYSIALKSAIQELAKQASLAEPQISEGESVVTARFKVNPRTRLPDRSKA